MTALAAEALRLARAAIGTTEHPAGSNRGPEIDAWLRGVGIDPEKGTPKDREWCAAFLSVTVANAAAALGLPSAGRAQSWMFSGSASCHRLIERNPLLLIQAPEPGCIFVHIGDDGHGHCGFVESIAAGGALETIEGNSDAHGSRTGGSVVAGFRRAGYVTHYLRIE